MSTTDELIDQRNQLRWHRVVSISVVTDVSATHRTALRCPSEGDRTVLGAWVARS